MADSSGHNLWDYTTKGGIQVSVEIASIEPEIAVEDLVDRLDSARGVLLSSSYEYPGRYTRWDLGFVDPPLVVTSHDQEIRLEALNERGQVLLSLLGRALGKVDGVSVVDETATFVVCNVERPPKRFEEEDRSRQPSAFSAVRASGDLFAGPDEHLGLYGAFVYDLAFQFEPIVLQFARP